ncbi:cell envelope biogenesis protein OmpA [Neptunitalea chrysea]|uniref:Cell envelope biogenesis protein OmpA n=1 Tax=Neptunitalea chrysea TaxID=1647581 RepID=A0A9W6ETH1_9FLAO|nr:OmpA family protein [Neptunitalea chrysea]GLB51049.1 cell envelope biogenesis protein OmpA [Neptunitalea chrysea]
MRTLQITAAILFSALLSVNAQDDVALVESATTVDRQPVRERRINKLDPSGFKYTVDNLKVNSQFTDLTNHIYKDKMIYSSSKKIGIFKSQIDPASNEAYKELFCGKIAKNGEIVHSTFFSNVINTENSNETYASFTDDEKTVYFTRSVKEGDKEPLKIFRARLHDKYEQWIDLEMLSFNMEGFDFDTPYISPDGSKLYFASNMPGTLGGYDLYVVDVAADGTTSTPRNLGNEINTTKNEKYPYMLDNALYFSSEGHYGLGGYDIFESLYVNQKFHFPANMGSSINSISDDFGFLITADNKGYFTSDREGGKGGYDIYKFEREKVKQFLDIQIVDENNVPIANTNIIIKDEYNRVFKNAATNDKGELKVEILPYSSYSLHIEKQGYIENMKGFESLEGEKADLVYNEQITLAKERTIITEQTILDRIVLFETDKSDINTDALKDIVATINKTGASKVIINAYADKRSSDEYNLKLSEKRAFAVKEYLLANTNINPEIVSLNFYGEHHPTLSCEECTQEQLTQNRRARIIVKTQKVDIEQ